jgi:formate dehydrogenase major subunit
MFAEVSPELAAERGLDHLGWAHVVTSRTAIECRVLVTDRLTPLRVAGRVVHQIWMPYHWGTVGVVTGESANDLFGVALDPNVLIQESKVTTCDIQPGRRPRGPELLDFVEAYRRRAGITVETGTRIATVGAAAEKAHLERAHDPALGPDDLSNPDGQGSAV